MVLGTAVAVSRRCGAKPSYSRGKWVCAVGTVCRSTAASRGHVINIFSAGRSRRLAKQLICIRAVVRVFVFVRNDLNNHRMVHLSAHRDAITWRKRGVVEGTFYKFNQMRAHRGMLELPYGSSSEKRAPIWKTHQFLGHRRDDSAPSQKMCAKIYGASTGLKHFRSKHLKH